MTAIERNDLVIEKGTDFSVIIPVFDNAKQPLAFSTTASGSAKIAKYPTATNVQSFVVGITTGNISISMASTISSLLDSGRNYYNVIVNDGDL